MESEILRVKQASARAAPRFESTYANKSHSAVNPSVRLSVIKNLQRLDVRLHGEKTCGFRLSMFTRRRGRGFLSAVIQRGQGLSVTLIE